MFDYTVAHWSTFFLAAFLLNISPGPDIAFILGHTVRGGKRAGIAAMFGLWAGAFCHVLFAALGLTAIVATSATAFSVVKWIGAAYLVWLGIQSLRSDGGLLPQEEGGGEKSLGSVFRQGVFIDLLNPKVATFFLAFLPQFIVRGAGPVWAQLMLHGTFIIVVAACVEPLVVLTSDRVTRRLRESRSLSLWLERGLGMVFISLGIKLAMTER
jgi:threonine/homoserine/homoserine lactone efflux protein